MEKERQIAVIQKFKSLVKGKDNMVSERCLSRLTCRQRQVYEMMQEKGATFASVAEKLNITANAVQERYAFTEQKIKSYEEAVKVQMPDREIIYNLDISRADLEVIKIALDVLKSYRGMKELESRISRNPVQKFGPMTVVLETSETISKQIDDTLKGNA